MKRPLGHFHLSSSLGMRRHVLFRPRVQTTALQNNFSINWQWKCVTWIYACMEKHIVSAQIPCQTLKSLLCVRHYLSRHTRGSCCINLDEESLRLTQLKLEKSPARSSWDNLSWRSSRATPIFPQNIQIQVKHIWQQGFRCVSRRHHHIFTFEHATTERNFSVFN